MNIKASLILLLFIPFFGNAAVVQSKLYIHSGNAVIGTTTMPYISYNTVDVFSQTNPVIILNVGDSLELWVVNRETATHKFMINGTPLGILNIPASDSIFVGYTFNSAANYIYHDPLAFPANTYLGLGGMIAVKNHAHKSFYWNIKEHDSTWNVTLSNAGTVNWNTYYPKHFTINGNSHPALSNDTTARITGNVGDTLILYIANTGRSIHSMHFHGFHATILYSSKNSSHVGRSKDTHPIHPLECLVLRIVPDKPGIYPVHDHNLVAVSGNNLYPNGMFTTLLINP